MIKETCLVLKLIKSGDGSLIQSALSKQLTREGLLQSRNQEASESDNGKYLETDDLRREENDKHQESKMCVYSRLQKRMVSPLQTV